MEHMKQFTRPEIISPEKATEMLSTIVSERKLLQYEVDQIASDMANGDFDINSPNSIAFDEDGHLIDGQHRLHAIIQSGVTIELNVTYNASGDHVDRPRQRSMADSFRMKGTVPLELCNKTCIAIVNTYLSIRYSSKNKSFSEAYKANFLTQNGSSILESYEISMNGAHNALTKKSGVQAALLGAIFCHIDKKVLLRFTECVNTGFINGESETAAVVLRTSLQEMRLNGGREIYILASMAEQALSDFVAGKPRRQRYTKVLHPYIFAGKEEEEN